MQTNKSVKKTEMWRRHKGTTAEELCAAIREIWLAKYPNYIRMLNEVPNRLIKDIATEYSRPTAVSDLIAHVYGFKQGEPVPKEVGWPFKYTARTILRDLEKFLSKQPYQDYLAEDDELDFVDTDGMWHEADAPLSAYIEADKKRDAMVEKYAIKPNEHAV